MLSFLAQWNCRSVRANSHWLRCPTFAQARILFLQETFLSPSDDFVIPGKNVFRKDRLAARGDSLVTALQALLAAFLVSLGPCSQPDFEVLAVKV